MLGDLGADPGDGGGGLRHCRVLRERSPPYRLRPDAVEGQSDALLLARLIRRRTSRCARLLQRAGSWRGLTRLTTTELRREHGLTLAQAERLKIALEIGRRLPFPPPLVTTIHSPVDVADLLLGAMPGEQERFWVVLLTTEHAVIAVETLYVGTIDTIVIRPAEVYGSAIRVNAAAIVVAHSQPSGEPEPSPEDVRITRELIAAGQLLELPLLDHLIVGNGRWVSLREWRPGLWTV